MKACESSLFYTITPADERRLIADARALRLKRRAELAAEIKQAEKKLREARR